MTSGRRALAHAREAADVGVEDGALLDELAALLHLELAGDHALGDVRREQAAKRSRVTISCSTFLREDVVLDEHRRLVGDGGDELEVLRLELRERLAVEPQHAEHFVVVQQRHDDGAS